MIKKRPKIFEWNFNTCPVCLLYVGESKSLQDYHRKEAHGRFKQKPFVIVVNDDMLREAASKITNEPGRLIAK